MALLTLAMGSLNSPDVAQEVHETVLRASGCLGAGLLQYGRPMPAGPLLEGVYLDDHLVACVVPRAQLYGSSGADRDLIEASHKATLSITLSVRMTRLLASLVLWSRVAHLKLVRSSSLGGHMLTGFAVRSGLQLRNVPRYGVLPWLV